MSDIIETKIETKSTEAVAAFGEFTRAFEAYKETNEARIEAIERKGAPDVLTNEKLARIDTALDETKSRLDRMSLDQRRPPRGIPEAASDPARAEHKAAFNLYVRSGEAGGLKQLEEKALSAGSGPDGGYLAPAQVESEVLRRLSALSPIRAIAGNRMISGGLYKVAHSISGPASGWVSETAARPQTDSPTLAELSVPAMELYAMPAATQTLLDDAIVDIDQWIAEEVETAFAEQEGAAFITGNGVNKPRGFFDYDAVADSAWEWGKLGFVASGAVGDFAAGDPSDALVDLIYALKAGYRQNASFVMNRKTQSAIRKFKDGQGNYLWQPPAGVGQTATLMNFPVVEAEDMPDMSADSLSIAFGDFRRGYLVVDRAGLRILRDPYSAKPYVLFYTTKRVGG
ncbi:MAG TPA: phage major capsid protein, partial [Saliniramus sp.]|nr:phage major capsid protein [Saliniramus sp.]